MESRENEVAGTFDVGAGPKQSFFYLLGGLAMFGLMLWFTNEFRCKWIAQQQAAKRALRSQQISQSSPPQSQDP